MGHSEFNIIAVIQYKRAITGPCFQTIAQSYDYGLTSLRSSLYKEFVEKFGNSVWNNEGRILVKTNNQILNIVHMESLQNMQVYSCAVLFKWDQSWNAPFKFVVAVISKMCSITGL